MQLPPYITKAARSVNAPSGSSSVTYDYSGMDELNKRMDEASKLSSARYKALYDGDVSGSVAAGDRIRSLLSSLGGIKPVRVASESSSFDGGGGSESVEGEHDGIDLGGSPGMVAGDGKRKNKANRPEAFGN